MNAVQSFVEPSQSALLRAVEETSLDLANVGDRQLMLSAIVRRTRALMGSDMAYVSLNDLASGTTYIHVTDGVRTPEYSSIRMPLGIGVLGSAAAGATTVHTVEYLRDTGLHHLADIDAIVAEEGVRAIAGAPMRLGGRIVGALLVAHRAPRRLGPNARAALEHMAIQAAVALEQTRRGDEIARLRRAGPPQTDANDRRRLEDLLALDGQLTGAMADSAVEPAAVLAVLGEAVGRPLALYEPNGGLRSGDRVLSAEEIEDWRLRSAVRSSRQCGEAAIVRLSSGAFAILAVTTAGEHLATLVMGSPDADAIATVTHATVFLSIALLVERTVATANENAQTSLMEELVHDRAPARPTLGPRLAKYGVTVGQPTLLLIVEPDSTDLPAAVRAVRTATQAADSLMSVHDGHLCVIANETAASTVIRCITESLERAGVDAVVGGARSDAGTPGELRRAHGEAMDVAGAATALGRKSGYADFTTIGIAGIMVRDRSGATAKALVAHNLGSVIEYDRRRRTVLTMTLWSYFQCGEQLAPTARALNVHFNTVRRRLERVDDLLGPSWRLPQNRFNVQVALHLWRASGMLQL